MGEKVLLATTVDWPSAARLAGAFAVLGATVEAVFPKGHVLGVSRYVTRAYRYQPLDALSSIARAIDAAAPDRIVPCDDRALSLLLKARARDRGLNALMVRSLGRIESYPVMMSRSASMTVAREEGITAPLTLAVAHRSLLPAVLDSVGLPAVLKTDGSWGGGGVAVVYTRAEAERMFEEIEGPPSRLRSLARAWLRRDLHFVADAIAPKPARVSVQEFVPGRPATSVFACREGRVLASLHMDVAAWEGAAGPASLMQRVRCPQMEEAARRIARRFALNGFIGLDFVRDETSMPHLIEINPRAAQICHLALGPDLVAALIDAPPRPPVTDKDLVALFPQLLKAPPSRPDAFEDMPWDDPAVIEALRRPEQGAPQVVSRLIRMAETFTSQARVNHSSAPQGLNRRPG